MQPQFSLILPDIRSCHNVGAMFRTADACGVDMMYLVGYTPHPPRPDIAKVALGAETWIPWTHEKNLLRLITKLQKQGVFVVALEKAPRSQDIASLRVTHPVALIVGNEVDGVSAKALARVDAITHIPMYGKKESLNVSVAAGIAMHAVAQALRRP